MSNPYTGTVASALRKSELLLRQECDTPLADAAIREASVLQLWRAYRAFLAELAFQLQLGSEPESAQALVERAAAQGKACGEGIELQELDADPDSWLARLQAAWVQLWSFSAEQGAGHRDTNLIPVRNLAAATAAELNREQLREWQAALAELVRRQRAHAEEW